MSRSIPALRTYLALPGFSAFRAGEPPRVNATLTPVARDDAQRWRALYAGIGGPYQWNEKRYWSDERILAHLTVPGRYAFGVDVEISNGILRDVGFLELEHHGDDRVEIGYFGLDQRMHGVGLGRWLLGEAVRLAQAMNASGVWLHTCSLDGPAALPNYLARGFVVTRTEEYMAEIRDD